jgi:hypothetical protein
MSDEGWEINRLKNEVAKQKTTIDKLQRHVKHLQETLRDKFICAALSGLAANVVNIAESPTKAAKAVIRIADAVMRERDMQE